MNTFSISSHCSPTQVLHPNGLCPSHVYILAHSTCSFLMSLFILPGLSQAPSAPPPIPCSLCWSQEPSLPSPCLASHVLLPHTTTWTLCPGFPSGRGIELLPCSTISRKQISPQSSRVPGWVQIPTLLITICVGLAQLFNLAIFEFPHLQNGKQIV